MFSARTLRWAAVLVFVMASMLNFLDRLTIAALAPVLMKELSINAEQYGKVLAAFSLSYALCATFAGIFIDRVGLGRGISLAVALWSVAGFATGWVTNLAGLVWARTLLGIGESAALPAAGKLSGVYLTPTERPLGAAVNQAGLAAGAALAPLFALWLVPEYGWRSVFFVTGALGFLWLPLWWAVLRVAPKVASPKPLSASMAIEMLGSRALWTLIAANFVSMVIYTLWTNWTTVYLVREHGLTSVEALKFSWLPPVSVTLGGFLGGSLSLSAMRRGLSDIEARLWVCRLSAAAMVVTALVPFTPTPLFAALGIGLSFFWSGCWSVNLYTLPVDVFGPQRAAAGVGAITFAFGMMQAVVSPWIGRVVDLYGFQPVCLSVALLPLVAYVILSRGLRKNASFSPAAA